MTIYFFVRKGVDIYLYKCYYNIVLKINAQKEVQHGT